MSASISFLGVDFANLTLDESVALVTEWARSGETFRYIVTPNVAHIVSVSRDPSKLKHLFEGAALRLCDSRILAVAGRKVADIDLEVVPGSDLTAALLPVLAKTDLKVGVIGSTSGDIVKLRERYPGLTVVHHDAPMGLRKSPEARGACLDFLRAQKPDVIFLAVGMPQQEMIAFEAVEAGDIRGVGLCIGASIDFLVGKQKRAPQWVSRMNLEWLHRMLSDPKRLAKRYLLDFPTFIGLLLKVRREKREC